MNRRLNLIVLATVVLSACGCSTFKEPSPEEILTGTWKPEDSYAIYQIAFEDGAVKVSGHSEHSGKRLTILDAGWDGEVLRFTSYMASTDMKVKHENRITGRKTMVSSIIGNKSGEIRRHKRVWNKVD